MNARTVKRLRKKIASYKTYEVKTHRPSNNSGISGIKVKADSFEMALNRYLKWYWNHFKERHADDNSSLVETTSKFGSFVVIDEKGFKKYYI